MHRTIFTTPVVNTLLRGLSLAFLKLTGWKVEGSLPPECPKCQGKGLPGMCPICRKWPTISQ